MIGRYKGINESEVFKNPDKLPALVYFRKSKSDENEPTAKE